MDELERVLTQTAEEAFERLAFLMPEPEAEAEAGAGPGPDALTGMVVRFRGPTTGALVLRADPPLMAAIAANMLGDDGALATALRLDALGELTNVICGNILPLVEGPTADFSLDAPVREAGAAAAGPVRAQVRLHLDGGAAEVALLGGAS